MSFEAFTADPLYACGTLGVSLSVHESPLLGPNVGELEPSRVVTAEPGLYDPDIGGVRVADLVVVTEDGYRNLNEYPKDLVDE